MHTLVAMIMVLVAFNGVLASPASHPSKCVKPVTTVTTKPILFGICPVCIVPTSTCSAGEPTGPTPRPPTTTTLQASKGACTATVEVINNPGCGNCATCTSVAITSTAAAASPGITGRGVANVYGERQDFCIPTTTVTTTVGPQTTEICACPAVVSKCSSGQPTAPPLPTATLTEGCVEEIVVGPGGCQNVCPTCAY